MRLGGIEALNFYQEVPKSSFHFAYINSSRNYIINKVENLLNDRQNATMFANKHTYTIHESNQYCSMPEEESISDNTSVSDFINSTYPKQKFLKIVGNILVKHSLITDDLFFKDFLNVHVADFCAYINNRFEKQENTRLIKLCKMHQSKNIKFPHVCIKNMTARRYLC
jgi:superfamily I DNA/RNA helicase